MVPGLEYQQNKQAQLERCSASGAELARLVLVGLVHWPAQVVLRRQCQLFQKAGTRETDVPRIVETIITTQSPTGAVHIAPLGLIADGERWIVAPFAPSRTLENLRTVPFACASHTTDVRVFAGCITGRKDWPLVPASKVTGARLAHCATHWELAVDEVIEDQQRPRFVCSIAHLVNHAPWSGYNRAESAVIECAVLASRLHMLPPEKIDAEREYLKIAISKTAGQTELEAWGWLMDKIDAFRAGKTAER